MKILVARGINLYSKTKLGSNIFNSACMDGSCSIIKYILSIADKTKINTEDMLRVLKDNNKLGSLEKEEIKKLILSKKIEI